jgi:LysR family glycine cleavage system transcriptional activator
MANITVNTYTNLVQAVFDGQGFALIGPPLMSRFLETKPLSNRSRPTQSAVMDFI